MLEERCDRLETMHGEVVLRLQERDDEVCQLTQQQRTLQMELRGAQAQVRTTQEQLEFAQVMAGGSRQW